jgi:hypothetical protein
MHRRTESLSTTESQAVVMRPMGRAAMVNR